MKSMHFLILIIPAIKKSKWIICCMRINRHYLLQYNEINQPLLRQKKSYIMIIRARGIIKKYAPYNCKHNNPTCLISKSCTHNFVQTSSASKLFDQMPHRALDNRRQSHQIQQQGDIHGFLLHALLNYTRRRSDLFTLVTLHCLALKIGALSKISISTSFLIFYARAGNLGSSWLLFDDMITRDVISWNAMISSCIYNQHFRAAALLFGDMMKEIRDFDSTTLLIVLSALSHSHIKSLKQGRVLHGLSLKLEMDSDSFLCNALADMYAKCGDLNSSESVFAKMKFRDTSSWNSIMSGCLLNGYPDKSLHFFKEMSLSGVGVDSMSLSCTISACSCLGDLEFGKSVHGWGIKLGGHEKMISHISVANSLISFYSHCGDIEAGKVVFESLINRDVISWNSMLDGFVENGRISEAFDLLHKMALKGEVQPDSVTVITVLPLCAKLYLPQQGRSIHGFSIRKGLELDLSVTNSLMDMYLKCDGLRSAQLLFKAISQKKDLISWNTMIAGYSQNGCINEAQSLFRELLCSGIQCSLSTLLAILPSCNCREALHFGRSIHCWKLKYGFSNNISAVNALMFMYINCGDLVASFTLLKSISIVADVVSWNTVIAGCVQNGHCREALQVFSLMRQRRPSGANPDSITLVSILSVHGNLELVLSGRLVHGLAIKTLTESDLRVRNALITMYCRCGDIKSAKKVFNIGPERNLCSWNCMISGLAQNKDSGNALKLFHQMELFPNEITIVSILSACSQLGALRHGREINGYVFRFELHQNAFISAALVHMYSKCGKLEIAFQTFQNSMDKSIASWNSMISAYGFHGYGEKAIQLFSDMCGSGIRATKSTFISLLSACSHSGLVDDGQRHYKLMFEEFGLTPTTEHHVCMVDMLGRAGRLGEAYEFIKQIPVQPAPGVWGALLSACKDHGDLEMGKSIAKHLFYLEPDNVGYHVLLSNMYAVAGKWTDAVEIRRMIQDRGLKKPPGSSFIDV